jgi:hypothetical protein
MRRELEAAPASCHSRFTFQIAQSEAAKAEQALDDAKAGSMLPLAGLQSAVNASDGRAFRFLKRGCRIRSRRSSLGLAQLRPGIGA